MGAAIKGMCKRQSEDKKSGASSRRMGATIDIFGPKRWTIRQENGGSNQRNVQVTIRGQKKAEHPVGECEQQLISLGQKSGPSDKRMGTKIKGVQMR
jgi:hypothetical protein